MHSMPAGKKTKKTTPTSSLGKTLSKVTNNALMMEKQKSTRISKSTCKPHGDIARPACSKTKAVRLIERSSVKIPNLLHFAWEGNNISEKNLANILLNKKMAPEFDIQIWTTNPMSIYDTLRKMADSEENAQFRYLARKFGNDITVKDTHELYKELATTLTVKDKENKKLTAGNYLSSIFYRETNGIYKNYAAASDITRAALMYLKGGCYMDVDVVCTTLNKLEKLDIPHGYLIGQSDPPFGLPNAMLVSLPKSPVSKTILLAMAKKIRNAERDPSGKKIDPTLIWDKKRSDVETRREETVLLTGPGLLTDINLHKKENIIETFHLLNRIDKTEEKEQWNMKTIDVIFFSDMEEGFNGAGLWKNPQNSLGKKKLSAEESIF